MSMWKKTLLLRSLQLNGNGFRSVPPCLAQLKIKELFLGNNRQGRCWQVFYVFVAYVFVTKCADC